MFGAVKVEHPPTDVYLACCVTSWSVAEGAAKWEIKHCPSHEAQHNKPVALLTQPPASQILKSGML